MKVRRSRPRKRERSTRRSTWESGVRRYRHNHLYHQIYSSSSLSTAFPPNHYPHISSSSLAVMTITVKKTEKRQQKFFTNQVGTLKPQSRFDHHHGDRHYVDDHHDPHDHHDHLHDDHQDRGALPGNITS